MAITPRTEQVLTTLTPADRARLDAYADEAHTSRAGAIHEAILALLDRHDKAKARRRPS